MKLPQYLSPSAVLSLLFFVATLPLVGADLTGKWAWTINTPNGDQFQTTMVATQKEGTLTGHLTTRGSENKLEIKKGKVKEGHVSFTVIPNFNGNEITVEYDGKVKDDAITGSIRVVEFDAELDWKAKRVPDAIDPSGSWDWTLETPDGGTLNATLELSLKDEKISGEVVADTATFEIKTGKMNGKKIEFTTVNPNSGQEYLLKGTITGKTMKGTVSFESDSGEERSLDWTAKKL